MKNDNITTIQLRESVKRALGRMKEKSSDSYEEIIVKLIDDADEIKRRKEELLKEQCNEMYDIDLQINKGWDGVLLDGLDSYEY